MGSDLEGFSKSPDMDIPASIPVTAGKKTANTAQKETRGRSAASEILNPPAGIPPKKKETREANIMMKIKSCAFKATSADI